MAASTNNYKGEQDSLLKKQEKNDLESPRSQSEDTCSISGSEGSEESFSNGGKDIDISRIIKYVKYAFSLALLAQVIRMIVVGIYAVETPVAVVLSPNAAFALMWLTLLWLGMLEGGQGCLVGLQPINRAAYEKSHPISFQCTGMVPNNEVLNRFIVGRQFFVVLMVYALNLCCSTFDGAEVPGFPKVIIETVLSSGLAVMIITVIIGQLSAEVTATHCMLDFVNSRALQLTAWSCLAIEASGILHAVYLVRIVATSILGEGSGSSVNEDSVAIEKTITEKIFYYLRIVFSFVVLCFVMVVVVVALWNGQSTMSEKCSGYFAMGVFAFLICFLGMCEAMQIALFAVVNIPDKILDKTLTKAGKFNYELAFRGENFRAFLIGRQICVTMSMFWLAKLTTTNINPNREATVLGLPAGVQDFFDTGLPGALITTIVASIAWRVIASTFPVEFMGNPMVYPFIRMCLALEASGVFSSSWLLADILKKVTRFQHDEVYLGDLIGGKHDHSNDMEETTRTTFTDYSEDEDESIAQVLENGENTPKNNKGSGYGALNNN